MNDDMHISVRPYVTPWYLAEQPTCLLHNVQVLFINIICIILLIALYIKEKNDGGHSHYRTLSALSEGYYYCGIKIGSMEVLCLDLMSERLQLRDLCY